MTYADALVMPTNYVVIDSEELSYVEGGGSAVVYDTAKGIRNRLTTAIGVSVLGSVTAALGGLLGGPATAVITGIIGGGYFDSYRSAASSAHNKAESIITKYGPNRRCKMTTTYSVAYYCTGITVSIA